MGLTPEYDGSVRIKDLNSVQQVRDDLQLASDLAGGNTEKISVGQLLSNVTLTGEASGEIASFSDALDASMKSCTVSIEPVQDLHGYDRPWAGGAGKNKFDLNSVSGSLRSGTESTTDITNQDGVITFNKTYANDGVWAYNFVMNFGSQTTLTVSADVKLSGTASTNNRLIVTIRDSTSTSDITDSKNVYVDTFDTWQRITKTFTVSDTSGTLVLQAFASGNYVQIKNVQLESGLTATSYEPYSNICPITGHDEVTANVVGKNLANPVLNGYYDESGFVSAYDWTACELIKCLPNKEYTLSNASGNLGGNIFFYDSQGSCLRYISTGKTPNTFTTPQDAGLIGLYGRNFNNTQLEIGNQATAYEPYNPNSATYTIDLGTTVYYATIDLVTGVMTILWAIVDLGTLDWNYSTARLKFYASLAGIKSVTALHVGNLLCSQYSVTSADNLNFDEYDGYCATINGNEVQIKDLQYTGSVAFKTAMNGVQLAYELATPYTVQLTPTQVRSLLGANNVWSDSGEMASVVYVRDINAVIGDIMRRLEALEPTRSVTKSVEAPAEEEEKPEEEAPAEK